jgi:hypothetical protein
MLRFHIPDLAAFTESLCQASQTGEDDLPESFHLFHLFDVLAAFLGCRPDDIEFNALSHFCLIFLPNFIVNCPHYILAEPPEKPRSFHATILNAIKEMTESFQCSSPIGPMQRYSLFVKRIGSEIAELDEALRQQCEGILSALKLPDGSFGLDRYQDLDLTTNAAEPQWLYPRGDGPGIEEMCDFDVPDWPVLDYN